MWNVVTITSVTVYHRKISEVLIIADELLITRRQIEWYD